MPRNVKLGANQKKAWYPSTLIRPYGTGGIGGFVFPPLEGSGLLSFDHYGRKKFWNESGGDL